jgi:rSAM/selenodomain-associated transferase 1
MNIENVLLIFIRNPESGKVKTRLAATIGNEKALKIYQELLRHTQEITKPLPVNKLLFYADFIYPNDNWPQADYTKFLQPEGDLGQKMQLAFNTAFAEGGRRVVIIGSDCYELTSAVIEQAYKALECYDAVIGPAADGGYYLLGFSRPNATVFQGKNWSTETVFQDTVNDLQNDNFSYFILPVLNDVDEEKDLGELRKFL